MSRKLENKVALVTGATRGIGFAIADDLAAQGAKIVVCATAQDKCQQVAEQLSQTHGVNCVGLKVDISKPAEIQDCVKTVLEKFEQIDILVNNAGIARDNITLRMSDDEWDQVLRINLDAVFYFCRPVLKTMLRKRSGRIINITSVVGLMGNPGQANYAASKAGVIGFTKSIAKEFGAKGITANAVAPGFIQTDMIDSLPKEYLDNIISQIPLRRLGQSKDVSSLVSFLASDDASYITGQVFQVDGGILM